jgi:MFS transporter, DHA2 family, multidrug resistance protein
MAPRGFGSFLAMPLVGMILNRFDSRKLLAIGVGVCALTLIQFSRLDLTAGYWQFFWPQIFMGLSLGFVFVPLTTVTMDPIPKESMGNATSLFNLVRNLGGSIGISAVETMQVRREQIHIGVLGAHVNALNLGSLRTLQELKGYFTALGGDPVAAAHRAYVAMWDMVLQQAAMLSYNDVFRLLGAMFLFMLPMIFLMRKPKGHGPGMAH